MRRCVARGHKRKVPTDIACASHDEVTINKLQRGLGATAGGHFHDTFGARIAVAAKRHDCFIRRSHMVGEAASETFWLVACRASHQENRTEQYRSGQWRVFHKSIINGTKIIWIQSNGRKSYS